MGFRIYTVGRGTDLQRTCGTIGFDQFRRGFERVRYRRHSRLAGARGSTGPAHTAASAGKLVGDSGQRHFVFRRVLCGQNPALRSAVECFANLCACSSCRSYSLRGDFTAIAWEATACCCFGRRHRFGGTRRKDCGSRGRDRFTRTIFECCFEPRRGCVGGVAHYICHSTSLFSGRDCYCLCSDHHLACEKSSARFAEPLS